MVKRECKLSGVSSYKGTNPIMEGGTLMTSSKPNYLPKSPSPNTITLGFRGRGVHKSVHSTLLLNSFAFSISTAIFSYLDYFNSFPAGLSAYIIPLKAVPHSVAGLLYLRQKSGLISPLQKILQSFLIDFL